MIAREGAVEVLRYLSDRVFAPRVSHGGQIMGGSFHRQLWPI
jgi:hypothetical protein